MSNIKREINITFLRKEARKKREEEERKFQEEEIRLEEKNDLCLKELTHLLLM